MTAIEQRDALRRATCPHCLLRRGEHRPLCPLAALDQLEDQLLLKEVA